MAPITDYVSITVSDLDESVTLSLACSDTLDDSSNLSKLGAMLVRDVRTGVISADLDPEPGAAGVAMLVLEDDEDGEVTMSITFDPVITPGDGRLSGGQALALSALQRVQHRIGLDSMTLTDAYCQ